MRYVCYLILVYLGAEGKRGFGQVETRVEWLARKLIENMERQGKESRLEKSCQRQNAILADRLEI